MAADKSTKTRRTAQKEAELKTKEQEKKADEPKVTGKNAEVNQGEAIANALREGLSSVAESSKKDEKFIVGSDPNVRHRFSVVRNKDGEVFVRDNEENSISAVQIQSLEEKDASVQNQDVEEL